MSLRDRNIWFFGTPGFAAVHLSALIDLGWRISLVVTQPDRPRGRGKLMHEPETKVLARERIPKATIYQPVRMRDEEARAFFEKRAEADRPLTAITASFGQILPGWLLRLPERGFINSHASLLPRWRGAAPINFAIWAGDSKSGVCLMEVVEALDAGPVYACSEVPIDEHTDAPILEERLASAGCNLLKDKLEDILGGHVTAEPQSGEGLTYAPKTTKQMGALDWRQPAADLERQVRALRPWPGTWTRTKGRQLKVLRVRLAEGCSSKPGEVLETGERLVVACGEGALELTEVQLEGKRAMPASDLLRGFQLEPGQTLELPVEENPAPR